MYKVINELLERSIEGDVASKEELLNRLYPLIISSINRYYPNSNDYEDLIQDGNIVILECIETYDKSRGIYFLGYVKTMLKFNYLQNHRIKHHISLNTSVGNEDDNEMIDFLVCEDKGPLELLIDLDYKVLISQALSILTDRQRQVIIYFYVKKNSIAFIAKQLNISYRTVVNTKTKALEKMKRVGMMRD